MTASATAGLLLEPGGRPGIPNPIHLELTMTDPRVRPIDEYHDQMMAKAEAERQKRAASAVERHEERDRLRAVVARVRQMADVWEQQLPEVIRTPAVVSALRAALEPAAPVVRSAAD